jgi:hypothetical protein
VIDDTGIEVIPGNADTTRAERTGAETIIRHFKSHDRIVSRTAAEVGNKNGC